MTSRQIQQFFANFGIEHGIDYKPIPMKRVALIVRVAKKWHHIDFARFVFDCFKPTLFNQLGIPVMFACDLPNREWFETFDRNHNQTKGHK